MPYVQQDGVQQAGPQSPVMQDGPASNPLAAMDYDDQVKALSYTVARGDTLGKIAGKTLGSAGQWRTIYDANRDVLSNPNVIHPGQTLKIPQPQAAAPEPVAPAPEPDGAYTVQQGDTLGKIASETLGSAARWRDIYNANRDVISDPNAIRVGWRLTIPNQNVQAEPEVAQADPAPEQPAPEAEGPSGAADAAGIQAMALQITEALETGGLGRYASINDYDAGIISYGKHQATLASGALESLLNVFLGASNSAAANGLSGYLSRVKSRDASLRNDADFKDLLRQAAAEPAMHTAQDTAIIASHYKPAAKAANEWNVSSPLGVSMLYDTNIQGGMATVLARTQSVLGGTVGEKGITELAFLQKFNTMRRARLIELANKYGLQTQHGKALKNSVYRCDAYDAMLATGNLDLVGTIRVRTVDLQGFEPTSDSPEQQVGDGAEQVEEPETSGASALSNAQVSVALVWYGERVAQYPKDVVKQIQAKVGASADGIIGPQTANAVATYQSASGLIADGKAGANTIEHMFGEDIRPQGGPEPGSEGFSRPHGLEQLKAVFGNPGTNQQAFAMRAGAGGTIIYPSCHKLVGPLFQAVFQEIYDAGLSHHIQSYDGIYNYRKKRSTSKSWSTHAWGIAIDVNASSNPMQSGENISVTQSQEVLAPFFEKHGFYWGKAFGDPMHFQYATGY